MENLDFFKRLPAEGIFLLGASVGEGEVSGKIKEILLMGEVLRLIKGFFSTSNWCRMSEASTVIRRLFWGPSQLHQSPVIVFRVQESQSLTSFPKADGINR